MTKMRTTGIKISESDGSFFEHIECTGFDVAIELSNSNGVEIPTVSANDCKTTLLLKKCSDSKFKKINVKLNSDKHQKELNKFRLTELNLSVRYWMLI